MPPIIPLLDTDLSHHFLDKVCFKGLNLSKFSKTRRNRLSAQRKLSQGKSLPSCPNMLMLIILSGRACSRELSPSKHYLIQLALETQRYLHLTSNRRLHLKPLPQTTTTIMRPFSDRRRQVTMVSRSANLQPLPMQRLRAKKGPSTRVTTMTPSRRTLGPPRTRTGWWFTTSAQSRRGRQEQHNSCPRLHAPVLHGPRRPQLPSQDPRHLNHRPPAFEASPLPAAMGVPSSTHLPASSPGSHGPAMTPTS